MAEEYFRGTGIKKSDLTGWIMSLDGSSRLTEIRYFGSRVFGTPRSDSDIDVHILLKEVDEEDAFSLGPLFSKYYRGYRIEFHAMNDFGDGYIHEWLLQNKTENELPITTKI